MGKYEPLPQFLNEKGAARLRLSFEQIEQVLGFKLPKSAYAYPAWWSNNEGTHSHAGAWLRAGWRTRDLDLAGHRVTFLKREGQEPSAGPGSPARKRGGFFGCMAGTVKIMPGVDLTEPTESWDAEDRPDDVLN